MDRLIEMEAFVNVVDHGGFTEAARRLNASKSAISKHVASLEARLGARLLERTTRRVRPTDIGRAYYDRALRVLAEAAEADAMAASMQGAPRGELRISSPVSFGAAHLMPAIADFLCAYPDITARVEMDDRFVDLLAEGFDMAVRIGHLSDSSLRARKLATAAMRLLASPDYLRRRGTPEQARDLADHDLLHYANAPLGQTWRLRDGDGWVDVRSSARLTVNNGEALLLGAEAGLGITIAPAFVCDAAVAEKRVVEVAPAAAPEPLTIWAVWPDGRHEPPKLRAAIDFLVARFAGKGPDWR